MSYKGNYFFFLGVFSFCGKYNLLILKYNWETQWKLQKNKHFFFTPYCLRNIISSLIEIKWYITQIMDEIIISN